MDLKQQLILAQKQLAGFEIPEVPHELLRLQALLQKTDFPDFAEVADIIGHNTVLSGEVVQVANQSQFLQEGAEPVHTIREAIDALGLIRLRQLVVALAFKTQVQGEVFDALLEHSVDVANVATEFSRWVDSVTPDEVYLSAILHNAGAILLAMKFDDYEPLFYNSLTNCYSGSGKEVEKYGVSHGIFGLLLAKTWNLEKEQAEVMLAHHQRDLSKLKHDKVRTLIALIQLANAIVSEVSFETYMGSEVKEMEQHAKDELMIEDNVIHEVRLALLSNSLV